MQLEITSKSENKLLNRVEAEFTVKECKVTPARKDLRGKVAALIDSKEPLVIIDRLEQSFGSQEVKGTARAYKDEEILKKTEAEYLIARNEGRKKEKKEEAPPARPPKEEAPEGKGKKEEAGKGEKKEAPKEAKGEKEAPVKKEEGEGKAEEKKEAE